VTGEIYCSKCNAPNPPETVYCGKCGEKIKKGGTIGEIVDPLIGSFVGDRFLVHEKLGEGGMGVVYRAEQTAIQRAVALKVLHSHLTQDESLHARFQNEAAASSRLTHPNTVTIYDFGKTDAGALYIAMEFVQGTSLDAEIRGTGALEWKRACRIAVQICGSLSDAHHHSIVHRDLKPENIMLCSRGGESDVVKVLDFGIAKILEDEGQDQRQALTKTGMVFGTPQYMSPEQIRGEKVDHRTDIYSLGVILYEMFTGVLPFIAEMPMGVLSKHLVDRPPSFKEKNPAVNVPESVEAIVMSTLSKKAEDRPKTMKELAASLAEAVGTVSMESPAKQTLAATVPTPSPGAGKEKKKDTAPPTPKTLKQPTVDRGAVAPRKKAGVAVGIAVAALVVITGGVGAWYFLAGPGSASGSQQTPPNQVTTVAQPTIQPIPQYAPPQVDTSTGLAAVPQPSVEQIKDTSTKKDKNKDKDKKPTINDIKPPKPDDEKPVEPSVVPPIVKPVEPAKPKEAKCAISAGNKEAMTLAMWAVLKAKEQGIKQCAKGNSGGTTKLSFDIEKGANRLTNIKTVISSPMDACLQKLISGSSKGKALAKKTGAVSFTLAQKDDVVTKCNVTVTTQSAKPGVIRIPKKTNTK
jgi:tRNA A-37 threonylcarbamoyl transferase component Bud32